jgi:hypothetical protein
MARAIKRRLRWLRYRRRLARAADEVRRSTEKGYLDSRVADRLLSHLAVLRDELGGGEGTS